MCGSCVVFVGTFGQLPGHCEQQVDTPYGGFSGGKDNENEHEKVVRLLGESDRTSDFECRQRRSTKYPG